MTNSNFDERRTEAQGEDIKALAGEIRELTASIVKLVVETAHSGERIKNLKLDTDDHSKRLYKIEKEFALSLEAIASLKKIQGGFIQIVIKVLTPMLTIGLLAFLSLMQLGKL